MKITINWVNRNANADGHHIYKSATPIDVEALPEPVASVTGRTTQWIDTDVKRGDKFFYRIGTYKGADLAISTEIEGNALPHSGPGPVEPLYGDYENGYFGVMESHELINGPELKALVGHTLSKGIPDQRWAKVAHKGKILYVPLGNGFGRTSWRNIYQEGLALGVDDVGDTEQVTAGGIAEGVNQLKTFEKFGSTFKVRLLEGLPNDSEFAYAGDYAIYPEGLEDSEFNQVMGRMVFGIYGESVGIAIPEVEATILGGPSYRWGGMLCQEILDGNALLRGVLRYQSTSVPVVGSTNTLAPTASSSNLGSTVYAVWRPILELADN